MKYHELQVSRSTKSTRVGRGISAGKGKTAGRGTKGQKSRSGYRRRPGFEGGQNPLMQRFPKLRGFHSQRIKPEVIFTDQLNDLGAKVDNLMLAERGLVSSPYVNVTLLTRGELKNKAKIELQKASKTALAMIEKTGGTFTPTPQVPRPASKGKDSQEPTSKQSKAS